MPPSIVAYLAGGESSLRTEIKSVQRNYLRYLADSADYGLLVFKLRRLGGHKPEHHLFVAVHGF